MIFKSQGGLDFELNYKYLSSEDHRGKNGPHKNRKVDLIYKEQLEIDLRAILKAGYYTEKELIQLLGLKIRQAKKAFRHLKKTDKGMHREDIIFKLLGDRYYT